MNPSGSRLRAWLSPLVHLSNNPISLIGVIIVTTATVFLIFAAETMWSGKVDNPYTGIVIFALVPTLFIFGLLLIPLGIWFRSRKEKRSAACIHEVNTLLASPAQATVRPRIGPRCSSKVMTSAINWQGCDWRVRPLITGTVA